ncbi:MAG TPA: hypothetical protein VK914_00970 [bacterium]|jgi:hypothetical protein|nr:hypothetical protein [bacterium]
MDAKGSYRVFFSGAALALSLWLCAGRLAAVALDDIPWNLVSGGSAAAAGAPYYIQTGDVAVTADNAAGNEAGAMWDPCTINLAEAFNLTFTINFGGNVYGCGADGMAFVLQNNGLGVVGAPSAEHGYDSGSVNGNSLAVVMDTWTNSGTPYSDPNYQSLGIEDNDSVSDAACSGTGPVTIVNNFGGCRPSIIASGAQATDAANHQVQFIWTPSGANATMTVFVDGSERAEWTVDNYANIFSNVNAVTFGITGGTGGGYNLQQAGLDAGSTVDNGTDVANPPLCGVNTPTPNVTPSDLPTPYNACSVTQPPIFTQSETFTISPTFSVSPTASPTFTPAPTDCGTPSYVAGKALMTGQPGDSGGSTTTNIVYNVPSALMDGLVVIVVQNNTGGQLVNSINFGGTPMLTPVPSVTNINGGKEALFELPVGDLAAGNQTVSINYNNTDNDPQVITIYVIQNVNQTTPIGQSAGPTTEGGGAFTASITPLGNYSMIMDFLVGTNGCLASGDISSSQTSTGLFNSNSSGTYTWTDYTTAGAEGVPETLHYDWSSSCGGSLNTWLVEVQGPVCSTSPTDSPTLSSTRTITLTSTPSSTDSPSLTPSDSPTPSFTPSPSDTFTDSPTLSDTPSLTASPTQTLTDSPSDTFTDTATLSDSPTPTDTASATPTATESASFTDSPTMTDTLSSTPSYTQSFTFTASPTSTDTPSATPSDTPSLTFTQSFTFTDTPSFSSTPSFTGTPSDTPSFTQSFTYTLTDTPTDTPTLTDTYSFTPTFTDSPTSSDTATFTDSPTITNTPVPVPVNLTVSVYNSAGELVKTLYQGGAESVPGGASLVGGLVVPGVQAVQVDVETTLVNGQNLLSWNGLNNNGQAVGGGVYTVQIVYVNNFGDATAYNLSVQVLGSQDMVQPLSIYNSAGELVWSGSLPSGVSPTATLALQKSVVPLALDPTTGHLAQPLGIEVGSSVVSWDGTNLQGQLVGPGTYSVELSTVVPGAAVLVQTKQFVMVSSALGRPSAGVVIAPDPWHDQQPLQVFYTPAVGVYGAVTLYNVLGQRLASFADPADTGTIVVPAQHYSAGIYMMDFRQMNGAETVARKVYKFAIVH